MRYENIEKFLTADEISKIDECINKIDAYIQDNAPQTGVISVALNDFDDIFNFKFNGLLFFESKNMLVDEPDDNIQNNINAASYVSNIKVYFQFTEPKKISKPLLEMTYLQKLYIIKNWERIKYFLLQYIMNQNKMKEKISNILNEFTL